MKSQIAMQNIDLQNNACKSMNRIKILYIDHNLLDLMFFQKMFGNIFDLALSDSVQGAISYLENNLSVKVIVIDLQIIDKEEIKLIDQLHSRNPDIIFFLLSSNYAPSLVETYLKSGLIKKYFCKPLDKSAFIKAVNKSFLLAIADPWQKKYYHNYRCNTVIKKTKEYNANNDWKILTDAKQNT